ncbi:hypothetical protein [Solidesulfovibrio sp. C21]|uniref:hypothetical protein n=1 Tax=Solidesulfovibrio sp. C21 TaxID=3398613 RepID=UPI0039FC97C2
MSEWIDLLNGFKGEKKMFFEKLQINNSKCKILNKKNLSMRTYQRLLETVSVDVKEIRYEGIKDFHKLAMNVNISQEKSMSVLSQVTGLSAKHINDVLNDSIQPTGNKHNDNSDIVNKIIKLYSAAKECQNDYIISNNIYKIEQINSKPNTIVFKYRENALKALKKMMQLKNS